MWRRHLTRGRRGWNHRLEACATNWELELLRIGDVAVAHPFALAALSGYSSLPMRRISREFGASYAVHEVVLGKSIAHASEWRDRILRIPDDDHPVGAQMMAAAPGVFAEGAEVLARAGFDVIDVNFGCPVPHVVRKQRGGFWLTQPDVALEIIRETLDGAGGKPVTLKLRRGWDHESESERKRLRDHRWGAGVGRRRSGRTRAHHQAAISRAERLGLRAAGEAARRELSGAGQRRPARRGRVFAHVGRDRG